MKKKLATFTLFLLIVILSILVYKTYKSFNTIEIKNYNISHDEKFGGVFVEISINDFNSIGFDYGDSLNVKFSTGYELKDIPYYNGYYVDISDPLVIGYPNHDKIEIAINYGDDIWKVANLNDKNTVTITLNEKKKYLDIQNASDIHYSDEQGSQTDKEFTNYRSVKVGNIKENFLYRSASPIDNSHKRASIVDKLIKEDNINFIIDLSDDDDNIKEHISKSDFNSPYFLSLYEQGKVIPLSMNMKFKEKDFSDKLVNGLTKMTEYDGPYLIHCVEGKDRTGFVIMILEGLAGANYQELVDDYMLTYKNYYNISLDTDKEKYNIIKEKNIDLMLKYITKEENLENLDYEDKVSEYLLEIGMKEEAIDKLRMILKKAS